MRARLAALAVLCANAALPVRAQDLAAGFANPPDSARPHTWWHWMDGNVTKEGITADLEAMRRVGIGGAQVFTVGQGIPKGPVDFNSEAWHALFKHAASEAQRLGLEICLHNCAGWSSSGGPWVKPEHGMQAVTTSEARVTGPRRFDAVLAKPPARLDTYRDIAVLAFPTPAPERATMAAAGPQASTSNDAPDAAKLVDGKRNTSVTLPLPTAQAPVWVQVAFAQPYTARRFGVVLRGVADGGRGALLASDDGVKWRTLKAISWRREDTQALMYVLEPATARFFRVRFDAVGRRATALGVAELEIDARLTFDNVAGKTLAARHEGLGSGGATEAPAELVVRRADQVDLSAKMAPDGKLTWDVPAGDWTVLRVGYTPNGRNNHPAPREGVGLEVDKLSREAFDAFWAGHVGKVLATVGPLAGKSFNNVLIDSYEVGTQNWTARFRDEFRQRRGYDPVPFLATFTGRVVDHPQATERFLWDLRRTVCDLMAENYFLRCAELCRRNGLLFSVEPYGNGPFEDMAAGSEADVPMGEFWGQGGGNNSTKLAASVAHVYGRTHVGAESFTCTPEQGKWTNDPFELKASGDSAWCSGVNRFIFHRYAHQPWLDRQPGMTMGQWGLHFERTMTWFEQSAAWLKYMARGQFLLQAGRFVADVLVCSGEDAPVSLRGAAPKGYDFDGCSRDAVLHRLSFTDGALTLHSGMRYRVLQMTGGETMTPALLRRLSQLVQDGATVICARPQRAPGLTDFPRCDEEIKALAAELWGNVDGKTVTERAFGKGRIVWGKPLDAVLADLGVKPDCEPAAKPGARLLYIHRRVAETELYFVSNQKQTPEEIDVTFRVSGFVPELWHAESGLIERAPVWREVDGRTVVPLRLGPAGSVFVVFRTRNAGVYHLTDAQTKADAPSVAGPAVTVTKAVYEATDGTGGKDVTALVAALVRGGQLAFQADNATLGGDPTPLHVKRLMLDYTLDGKPRALSVPENQSVDLAAGAGTLAEPTMDLAVAADGSPLLWAWCNGTAQLTTITGKVLSVAVRDVPAPLAVAGPWALRFPPKWGAPEQVTLPKLVSWSDHPDAGVRYFSGTASYHQTLDVPPALVAPDRRLWLDLGQVKNLAQVFVNGRDLGVLWQPPFRVELTDVVKPGANRLEVRLTNLWPNRLIGDEQLPDDRQWDGMRLTAWPRWLLEGKPSPTGRYTFTTWHHWTKDMALLESGLLGPVRLRCALRVEPERVR